ncbi:LysR family transcriptional regulator [Yokenella regensburgei]|uniref:LysR substrate-binding domain-containing protein n=1 Tax=Yokenella regensburgei TaxID=158877 RepID=UPI003F136381
MDKLRAMAVFITVADEGSFTRAALRLEMSAVMVGKYISSLEAQLDTRLVERNTRRQSLTDAGRVYYEEARRVLEQVHLADTAIERLRNTPAGTLRVSAPTTLGACVIAPLTAAFLNAHPHVKVELDLSNRRVDLVEEGIDVAVRIGGAYDDTLVAKPLCLYRMVICASPDYLARFGVPETPRDLQQHRCLSHMVWNSQNEWKLPDENAQASWRQEPVLRCNDGLGLSMAARAGAGLLMQPEILVKEALEKGQLIPVLRKFTPLPRPVFLLSRPQQRPLPKVARYRAHLLEHITDWIAPG